MSNYNSKKTVNSMALSMFIGSRLMPGRDGKAQRPLTAEEAYRKAKERSER